MHPEQKGPWIEHVKGKIAETEAGIQRKDGDYAGTESAMTSRHDHLREDLAVELVRQGRLLVQQRDFLAEIKGADLRYCVEPGAWLDLLVDDVPEQYLFMNTRGDLPDIEVITSQSPMGRAIERKIPGEKASFRVGSRNFRVEIKSIL